MMSSLPTLLTLLALSQTPSPASSQPTLKSVPPVSESAPRVQEPALEEELPALKEVAPTLEAPDSVVETPAHPCAGKPIYSVRLAGCKGPVCESGEMLAGFVSLTDISPGQVLNAADIARAIGRLEATGFFRSVALTCRPKGEEVVLVIEVRPHRFVRKVSVEGNQYFREAELAKRLTLHSGDPLDVEPGRVEDNETVQRLIESLRALYLREGLQEVYFDVTADLIDETTLDLTVHIEEGERDRVRALDIQHIRRPVSDPNALACPKISKRKLTELVAVGIGEVVTERQLRKTSRRLKKFFQSVGYERPSVKALTVGDPLTLRVRVKTNRCWLVRVWEREAMSLSATRSEPAFRFRDPVDGVRLLADRAPYLRSDLEEWRPVLPFAESGVFEREEAMRGVEAIHSVLESQGYFFGEVRLEHRRLQTARSKRRSDKSTPSVMGTVDYYLTRNYERRLQGLTFTGLETFTPQQLQEIMDTRVYDFLEAEGYLQLQQVFFDLTKVKRFYQERGFYDFRYGLQGEPGQLTPRRQRREEGEWVIWEHRFRDRGFRVRKRKGEMVLYLEIPIIEGPRTKVSKVTVLGTNALKSSLARRLLGFGEGDPYGKFYLEEGLKGLKQWYAKRGYHRTRLFPTCEAHDPEPLDGLCDAAQVRSNSVEFVLRVDEGPRSHVGEIFWRGNFRTDPEVLLRDLPQPGTPYREAAVSEASRKLRNLGVFNSVKIQPIGLDETPSRETIALVVSVEEGRTRFLDFAIGFRTIDREYDQGTKAPALLGSIIGQATAASDRSSIGLGRDWALSLPDVLLKLEVEFLEYNFLGLGWQFSLPFEYGFSTNDYLRLGSLTPTLRIPRPGGTDLDTEFKLLAELDRVNDPLDRTEFGLYSSLNWPVVKHMSLGVGLDFGMICFKNPESHDPICDMDEYSPQFRPSLRWRWDTQDNPLNPTRGFTLGAEFKYIFGRSRDELVDLQAAEQLSDDFANFLRWEASAEVVIDTRIGPVLAAFVRYGGSYQIGGDGNSLLPANEIYTLGGSNGMRGYADHSVGRYDANGWLDTGYVNNQGNLVGAIVDYRSDGGGNVVLNGNVEVRLPIFKRYGVWAATFLDVGAVARDHSQIYPESFRFSTGLGVRYLIGNQIPLRLDWGLALGEKRCLAYSPTADFTDPNFDPDEACASREDGYQIHLDLLYPF